MSRYKGHTLVAGTSSSIDFANKSLSNLNSVGQAVIDNKANTSLSNLDTVGQAILDNKANTSLSNLDTSGEKHFLNKTQISNCITEIPQDIKLELTNGTLTLKAGSKVYVPNGFEEDGTTPKFDSVITSSDISTSANWTSNPCMMALNSSQTGTYSFVLTNQYSGPSAPTSLNTGTIWYDTTNNIIKRYNGSAWESGVSFPLCIGTMVSGTGWTSINQVFNGFGYMGSTVFVLPGVKGLIPAGRNADGTLKNIEAQITSPLLRFYTYQASKQPLVYSAIGNNIFNEARYYVSSTEPCPSSTNYVLWYNPIDNLIRCSDTNNQWTIYSWLNLGMLVSTDTSTNGYKVTALTQTKTIQLVTEPSIIETYVNGTSWYRVWSDGWCEQGGQVTTSNNSYTVTLLKTFNNTNYCVTTTPNHSGVNDGYNSFCYKSSGSQLVIYNKEYGTSVNTAVIWQASGYTS